MLISYTFFKKLINQEQMCIFKTNILCYNCNVAGLLPNEG